MSLDELVADDPSILHAFLAMRNLDLKTICHNTVLRTLHIQNNGREVDLECACLMKSLATLVVSDSRITPLSPFSYNFSITSLTLQHANISDISSLRSNRTVRYLNLSRNKIRDISPLEGNHTLRELHLDNNLIKDITPLRDHRCERIWLSNNKIESVVPLKNNQTKVSLHIIAIDNRYQDLDPLLECTGLVGLTCGRSSVLFATLSYRLCLLNMYNYERRVASLRLTARLWLKTNSLQEVKRHTTSC
jgi:Leucine-rich repeat (LRR) protein